MNIKRTLLAAAAICAAFALARANLARANAVTSRPAQETPYKALDAYIQDKIARLNLPGAALAIVCGGFALVWIFVRTGLILRTYRTAASEALAQPGVSSGERR